LLLLLLLLLLSLLLLMAEQCTGNNSMLQHWANWPKVDT
jgi:hypothetical protein